MRVYVHGFSSSNKNRAKMFLEDDFLLPQSQRQMISDREQGETNPGRRNGQR